MGLSCPTTSLYVHSPTVCHNFVAYDLVEWDKPNDVRLCHYNDDFMLTSASLEALEKGVVSLSAYL